MPSNLGLPPQRQLAAYEIWDSYFTPVGGPNLVENIERCFPTIELGQFQKLVYFASGAQELEPLKKWPDRFLAMLRLNAGDVPGSLAALDRWVRDGPMVGVYFLGGVACNHPNFNPLIQRIAELKAVIMQHTWNPTGGKSRPELSTPAELAELAARFPKQQFICAHAGGEWERGIRAIRSSPNILVETSGFDPTAGFIEMAVRELGAERIIFGSHLPSRSLGTELGKVIAAEIEESAKHKILGTNFRQLLKPILDLK